MRKEMFDSVSEEKKGFMPMNLQFFASSTGSDDGDDDNDDGDEGAGGEGSGDDGGTGDGKDGGDGAGASGGSKGKGAKTFTQAQVNTMMTREKRQGRNAAFNELGIDPKDSKLVKMVKSFVASQKDDGNDDGDGKASEVAAAESRALKAEAKAEAMVLGAKAEFVDDVIVLAMAKMDDDADLKTVIEEIKTKYPSFFGAGTDGDGGSEDDDKDDKGKSTGKRGTGASLRNLGKDKGNKDKNSGKGLGSRLAAQKKSTVAKSTRFIGGRNKS